MIATALFIGALLLPSYHGTEPALRNYGVKNRSLGATLLSKVSSNLPITQELAYRDIESWVQYIKQASSIYRIPEETLAAILFEEALHRKPVDIETFGPAQLGVGELIAQGLPPKRELLEDPEMSIWVLTRQLSRLRKKTGSLDSAITLHNGYEDFLLTVKKRQKDVRLLMLLDSKRKVQTLEI
jgi:hypothetical protein